MGASRAGSGESVTDSRVPCVIVGSKRDLKPEGSPWHSSYAGRPSWLHSLAGEGSWFLTYAVKESELMQCSNILIFCSGFNSAPSKFMSTWNPGI